MQTKEHRLTLGKCDYDGSGNRNCEAAITWTWDGKRFSMQAEIWNPRKTDIYRGGQCVDAVAAMFPHNEKAARMVEVWKRWHLNDMRPGCEHQRAEWNPEEELEVVSYKLTTEAYRMRESAIARGARCAAEGRPAELTETERALVLLADWYKPRFQPPDADSPLSGCYEVDKRETKSAGWVYPSEHERGLLTKPCPVCGCKYGSEWRTEQIPAEVVAEIESW